MKLPLRWLESYVPVELSPTQLAERLTMSGSLVERVENAGSRFDDVLLGRIAQLERHPNADSLWLATVDLGSRSQTVVTGAPNLFEGALVPFIGVGKRLPGQDKPLEGKMLRGIRSEGMVCSGRELGLNDNHDGILILDEAVLGPLDRALGRLGEPLSEFLGEWVLELEITSNRPDCLSIYGMAREVAAITGAHLQPLPQPPASFGEGRQQPDVALAIEDSDLCSRISACVVAGIRIGDSPKWLVDRLLSAGVRAINNVVDITNYVMLELGQPLHAYDLDTLSGPSLRVRRAHPGERLTTLDGVARTLTSDMLLICDDERPVGLAGVMGGLDTEVSSKTTNILLEAATFNPANIRRTSVALGLRSEASSRFEKGLPVELAGKAARRAAMLMAELAGGTVVGDVFYTGIPDPAPRAIEFDLGDVERLLGVTWSTETIVAQLRSLQFIVADPDGKALGVTVPWWRADVVEGADLVEEVARIAGYDAIPETLLRGSVPPRPLSPGLAQVEPARALLLSAGVDEACSSGLSSQRLLEMLRPDGATEPWLAAVVPNAAAIAANGSTFLPVRVINPLSPDREILRPTLLPSLLEAVRNALRLGEGRIAFFELDFCAFGCEGRLPVERRTLALAMAGSRYEASWGYAPGSFDFFDGKGIIETLLARLGVADWAVVPQAHPLLHPGRSAAITVGGNALGFLGELHPVIAERWDLGTRRAYIAEMDFDALANACTVQRAFVDYPRQALARRDLAVVVDDAKPAASVLKEVQRAAKGLLAEVVLFDIYRGDQIPPGKKSLALALGIQSGDHALSEEELDKTMYRIRKTLEHRVGATFRG